MKKALLVIAIATFCGCKKEEPYNCGQAQADYFLLCQQRVAERQKQELAEAQLKAGFGPVQALISRIEISQEAERKINDQMVKMGREMKNKGCPTNIKDDCLK